MCVATALTRPRGHPTLALRLPAKPCRSGPVYGVTLMPVVEESVFINRPPGEVFQFLIKTENIPIWDSSVIRAEQLDDGLVGPGTRSKGTSKILGRQFDWVTENVHFDPPKQTVIRSVDGKFG